MSENIDIVDTVETVETIKKKCGRPSKGFNAKEWRENNKEKLKAYGARKVRCDVCNVEIRYDSLATHKKSARHLKRTV